MVLVERDADHDIEAFGVMYVLPSANGDGSENGAAIHRRAALVLMAPHAQSDELMEAWMYLAQEFVVEAAQRGAHHIVAEAPEIGGEAEALQGAGFVPLIQQDVLKLANKPDLASLPEVNGLREQTKDDEPLIKALHLRAAPKMTYQAEVSFDLLRATHRMDRGFVLMRGNELVAHVSVRQGKRGYGMQALFRPDAEQEALPTLRFALAHLMSRTWRPVYLTVRHYQSWMLPILDQLGFVHMTSTMLMVRHTAARVHQPIWSPVAAEGTVIKNTHSASIHLESRVSPSDGEDAYSEDALASAHDYARTANH